MATALKDRPQAETAALRLTVDRADFLKALAHAAAIVERRNTIPVLSNVLLQAEGEQLRLTSTDLNMQASLVVAAHVSGEGGTTVSAALLHGIVRELPEGCQVELKLEDSRLHVIGGRSRYKLQTLPERDFPVMKGDQVTCELSINAKDLVRSIAKVAPAQDTDNAARPYTCGICFEAANSELTLVATDGKRVAWAALPAPAEVELKDAIFSSKLVTTLTKLLDGFDDDVRLAFDERKVVVTIGDAVLTGKLVDGQYPPWRRILPAGEGKRLLISGEALHAAVRRVAMVANDRVRAVKIELATDKLTVSCISAELGSAVEEAPCVWDAGDYVRGFNVKFLLETLAAAKADELQIDMYDGAQGLTLVTNPADSSAKWLLSQMSV